MAAPTKSPEIYDLLRLRDPGVRIGIKVWTAVSCTALKNISGQALVHVLRAEKIEKVSDGFMIFATTLGSPGRAWISTYAVDSAIPFPVVEEEAK